MLDVIDRVSRAGFILSRALFRKNVGPFTRGGRTFFPVKKLATFFSF